MRIYRPAWPGPGSENCGEPWMRLSLAVGRGDTTQWVGLLQQIVVRQGGFWRDDVNHMRQRTQFLVSGHLTFQLPTNIFRR